MGCDGSQTKDETKAKQFHEMSEEEKEKVKKQMEEQDKDLKEEVNEGLGTYERYDWDELMKKLPTQKTTKERKERLDLWNKINEYGNGYVSFKRLSVQLDKHLDLPNVVRNKGPIKLAFNAASNKVAVLREDFSI